MPDTALAGPPGTISIDPFLPLIEASSGNDYSGIFVTVCAPINFERSEIKDGLRAWSDKADPFARELLGVLTQDDLDVDARLEQAMSLFLTDPGAEVFMSLPTLQASKDDYMLAVSTVDDESVDRTHIERAVLIPYMRRYPLASLMMHHGASEVDFPHYDNVWLPILTTRKMYLPWFLEGEKNPFPYFTLPVGQAGELLSFWTELGEEISRVNELVEALARRERDFDAKPLEERFRLIENELAGRLPERIEERARTLESWLSRGVDQFKPIDFNYLLMGIPDQFPEKYQTYESYPFF